MVQHGPAPFSDERCECATKLSASDYRWRLENASLVVCHAGQGALLEAAALGKSIITVPRLARLGEHVDDHQIEFAGFFEEQGWAVVPASGESLMDAITRIPPQAAVPPPDFARLARKVTELITEQAELLGLDGPS